MKNTVDYVREELQPFTQKPVCEVDSLVFSQLSYFKLEKADASLFENGCVSINDLWRGEYIPLFMDGMNHPEDNYALLSNLAASPRFRDVIISDFTSRFDSQREEQFCAMTMHLPDGGAYVAFRGTDSTLIGWKEDFNMAFCDEVPAQREAKAYLDALSLEKGAPLYIGGHSKGGNLAVYSAMHCSDSRAADIAGVFSHDGPGFRGHPEETEGYIRIAPYIHKTVPRSSMIGMLLENQENYRIVESTGSGLMQHNPFTWELRDGDFIEASRLSFGAMGVNETLSTWLGEIDDKNREVFVDTLFAVIGSSGATTTRELSMAWIKNAPAMLATVRGTDKETLDNVKKTMGLLARSAVNSVIRKKPGADI